MVCLGGGIITLWHNISTPSPFKVKGIVKVKVYNRGHDGMVISPNHTLILGKLEQAVNQYFVHILSLVTDNIPS